MFHTWRVKTLLIVPKHQANQPAVGETLLYESRLPKQARKYGGIPVVVRKPAREVAGLGDGRSSSPRRIWFRDSPHESVKDQPKYV
jgi:hypothetical protein